MGMSASKAVFPEVMMDMNMTPLIDVMLVMIIMMIITIPIQNHSINLNLPFVGPPTPSTPKPVELAIDFDGSLYWNGVRVNRTDADARLAQLGAMPQAGQPELHINPNRLVDYKTVAAILAMAQRHSVEKIGMVGNEQFQ
ncbi:MAG: biopolymer transporter ExbD [Burkholderiaceae bacterium]|nr:biopolymer transporter ExbD [Burkholderiaceae bacterium]